MKFIIGTAEALSWVGAVMAAAVVVAMTGHTLFEIALRAFFSRSTYVLDEFVGYGVAASTFLALGYTLKTDGHIRVNILLSAIRNRTMAICLEVLCTTLALALTLYLMHFFWRSVSRNWSRGAVSDTVAQVPLWIPEGLVVVGLFILAFQLVARILQQLVDPPAPPGAVSAPAQEH